MNGHRLVRSAECGVRNEEKQNSPHPCPLPRGEGAPPPSVGPNFGSGNFHCCLRSCGGSGCLRLQRRSAPVLGRSKPRLAEGRRIFQGSRALSRRSARGRSTLHGSSTVASVRFLWAAANPARGDLSIARPPLIEHPFCFSSARRRTAHVPVHKPAAAPMKNKKEDIIRLYSINRSPLTGLEHAKTAEGSGESWHFLSAFCTSHDACKVQREWAHSVVASELLTRGKYVKPNSPSPPPSPRRRGSTVSRPGHDFGLRPIPPLDSFMCRKNDF
jgi:hypothetical protein